MSTDWVARGETPGAPGCLEDLSVEGDLKPGTAGYHPPVPGLQPPRLLSLLRGGWLSSGLASESEAQAGK